MLIAKGSPIGRVLLVSIALLANLLAVGVPVLHAWAHERDAHADEAQGHEFAESGRLNAIEHPHDEVHPAVLHEDGQVLPRSSVDFGQMLQPEPIASLFVVISSDQATEADRLLLSRAPPGEATARAPPLQ